MQVRGWLVRNQTHNSTTTVSGTSASMMGKDTNFGAWMPSLRQDALDCA